MIVDKLNMQQRNDLACHLTYCVIFVTFELIFGIISVHQYLEKAKDEFDSRWHEAPRVRESIFCASIHSCRVSLL